ncbi:oxidoreductase [Leptobacterium flavescens]|uniref:NADPH--hemoprotein reductase n=1 Tax=Leptobacterium flavescens TaxID=472055 RepID=A0A6P0UNP4_9FLAO|nr:PepSY domain-containing protein [Leptobacterium flavescens]NER12613.1 oxidoreductase [Leptobacterium flavescens]
MTLSIWRYSHFLLALISSLFLIIASVSGVILAFEPISQAVQPYDVADIRNITLSETMDALNKTYEEVLELEVTTDDFVKASVITDEGNSETIYIHPNTAEKLGSVQKKTPFFSFMTSLHRSLFLKSTGRFFVGLVSLLLCLIAVTGIILIAKRQGGIKKWFTRVQESSFGERYHVILGRWMLIPLLIITVTGVYLSAEKFSLLPEARIEHDWDAVNKKIAETSSGSGPEIFSSLSLKEVRKLVFPFSEAPEDYYELALKDRELLVHQYTGEILSEIPYPFVQLASRWSLLLHTGEGSILWSLILLIASASILFFIYTGFAMTLKRRRKTKAVLPEWDKDECEYILLIGSETGNTYAFAKVFYKALVRAGKKVFLSSLNDYSTYAKAKHLIVFTATYGDGDAPANARLFEKRFAEIKPVNTLQFSVVGFGSTSYPNYCRFAIKVDGLLQGHPEFRSVMPLMKINDQSESAFKNWVKDWSTYSRTEIEPELPSISKKKNGKQPFKVVENSELNADDTFLLQLRVRKRTVFQSGDLINITPPGEEKERQYSIARIGDTIFLSVKKHALGKCSSYLSELAINQKIRAGISRNPDFHFPKNAPEVLLISNGTGIAPFLGMLNENKNKVPVQLYWGGRTENSFDIYRPYLEKAYDQSRISAYHLALSREGKKEYVQDILSQNKKQVVQSLERGGVIMICGSLTMQRSVLDLLENVAEEELQKPLSYFEDKGQLAMDCY